MLVDAVDLLHELDFTIAEGSIRRSWLLRSADGRTYDVEPTTPVDRVTAQTARNIRARRTSTPRRLLVGRSATAGILADARAGHLDLLTEAPLRLIVNGDVHELREEPVTPGPRPTPGPAAWYRWGLERLLLIADAPRRQTALAEALGTSQQTVSNAARALGDLVSDRGYGLEAVDRRRLLHHWAAEYPGAGGQEFGWYSLESPVEQTLKAADVATLFGSDPLLSGDVAADRLAPWRLPTRGRVYITSPVDLADDGFVPAPVEEATLITCVPQDPTVWRLAARSSDHGANLVDAALVYWDVHAGSDADCGEAAEKLQEFIVNGGP